MFTEDQIESLIVKLFSECITPDEKTYLLAWVNSSARNRRYYEELKNIWQVSHPAFPPAEIDVAGAERKVMGQMQERKLINSSVFVWWQRVAAILIIPVIMFTGYLLFNESSRSAVIAYQEISSPFGMSSKVDLPDGSTVWLNSGSKLKYPVVFAENERNVFLSGEAFFKVHADKKHPFIVKTESLNVLATGTQFNVEAYLLDTITAVTLVEGKVDVKIGSSINEKLQPNQRLVLNSNSKTYQLTETDSRHWGLWKDGILAFRDEPLADVFKRIGRTFNVDIQVKDSVIARQLYRATFEGESLDEILRLLKMTAPIQYNSIGRGKQTDSLFNKEKIEVYREQ